MYHLPEELARGIANIANGEKTTASNIHESIIVEWFGVSKDLYKPARKTRKR